MIFSATWCPPCKKIGPEIDKLATQYTSEKMVFVHVNVDTLKDTARRFGIEAMPTSKIIQDGKEKAGCSVKGGDLSAIKSMIESSL